MSKHAHPSLGRSVVCSSPAVVPAAVAALAEPPPDGSCRARGMHTFCNSCNHERQAVAFCDCVHANSARCNSPISSSVSDGFVAEAAAIRSAAWPDIWKHAQLELATGKIVTGVDSSELPRSCNPTSLEEACCNTYSECSSLHVVYVFQHTCTFTLDVRTRVRTRSTRVLEYCNFAILLPGDDDCCNTSQLDVSVNGLN